VEAAKAGDPLVTRPQVEVIGVGEDDRRAGLDEIVGVELPAAVELVVRETEPGMQGDRVSGARKAATLETGLVVQVPLFVNIGDRVKVDTRSSDYLSRA